MCEVQMTFCNISTIWLQCQIQLAAFNLFKEIFNFEMMASKLIDRIWIANPRIDERTLCIDKFNEKLFLMFTTTNHNKNVWKKREFKHLIGKLIYMSINIINSNSIFNGIITSK